MSTTKTATVKVKKGCGQRKNRRDVAGRRRHQQKVAADKRRW